MKAGKEQAGGKGAPPGDPFPEEPLCGAPARCRLILSVRQSGVTDARVLNAIESVPRERFVDSPFLDRALDDIALPIACGQTISQPSVVALMTQALDPAPAHRILEIGTGSGYQAAVLARLCRRVYTIERHVTLARRAAALLHELGVHNVSARHADGSLGWPEQAPFARIMLTAACDDPPRRLLDQLTEGGVMVAPVGCSDAMQQIIRIEKHAQGLRYAELGDVRFVPLLEGIAQEE